MKVLIAGAAGVLGKAVTALLEREQGVQLLLTDGQGVSPRHVEGATPVAPRRQRIAALQKGDQIVSGIR